MPMLKGANGTEVIVRKGDTLVEWGLKGTEVIWGPDLFQSDDPAQSTGGLVEPWTEGKFLRQIGTSVTRSDVATGMQIQSNNSTGRTNSGFGFHINPIAMPQLLDDVFYPFTAYIELDLLQDMGCKASFAFLSAPEYVSTIGTTQDYDLNPPLVQGMNIIHATPQNLQRGGPYMDLMIPGLSYLDVTSIIILKSFRIVSGYYDS